MGQTKKKKEPPIVPQTRSSQPDDDEPLTQKELDQISGMAAVRLPMEMIATLMGFGSKDTLEKRVKKDPALRSAIDRGRANASGKVRNHLYAMQFDETLPPQIRFQAGKFWAQTQEGFKTADRLELTGADGAPIEVTKLTSEERMAAIKALDKKLALTEDE